MNTEVTMLPISAGDATLIVWSDGGNRHVVLIDAGLDPDQAISYLQSVGIFHLDLIILSHPDMDHLGGLLAIISSPVMSVNTIWCFDLNFLREFIKTGKIPRPREGTREVVYDYLLRGTLDEFSDILRTAHAGNVQVLQVSEGYKLSLGGALFEVLYPPQSFYDALSSPIALKRMLINRGWPEEWTREREIEQGAKARSLHRQERQERLSEMVKKPEMPEDGFLLSEFDEISGDQAPPKEPPENGREPAKLPWKMVGTLYNNLSIVVKVTNLGGINAPSLLFPGDLSDWTTLVLRQWPNLQADVLKIPHHGSKGISFDLKMLKRALKYQRHLCCDPIFALCCPGYGPETHARSRQIYDVIFDPVPVRARDPVRFLEALVGPEHLLVFPHPHHNLPSMRLSEFRGKVIANRINRDLRVLAESTNNPSPTSVLVGLERHDIREVAR